jgi:hypothetical protein
MEPSTRTPEGEPNRCSVCGKDVRIEPSRPPGDAPCPHCGSLLWFAGHSENISSTELPSHQVVSANRWKRARKSQHPQTRLLAQVAVAAAVGFVLSLSVVISEASSDRGSPAFCACSVGATVIGSVMAGFGLALRDYLHDRLLKRQGVNVILRAYFAWGFVSLALCVERQLLFRSDDN